MTQSVRAGDDLTPFAIIRMLSLGECPSAVSWAAGRLHRALVSTSVWRWKWERCPELRCVESRTLAVPVRSRQSNGVELVVWRGLRCGHRTSTIGVARVPYAAELPLFDDNTDATPCERCGATDGVELHHWAPRHLFDDADAWPTGSLCRSCHREWHSIVTPTMSRVA